MVADDQRPRTAEMDDQCRLTVAEAERRQWEAAWEAEDQPDLLVDVLAAGAEAVTRHRVEVVDTPAAVEGTAAVIKPQCDSEKKNAVLSGGVSVCNRLLVR